TGAGPNAWRRTHPDAPPPTRWRLAQLYSRRLLQRHSVGAGLSWPRRARAETSPGDLRPTGARLQDRSYRRAVPRTGIGHAPLAGAAYRRWCRSGCDGVITAER